MVTEIRKELRGNARCSFKRQSPPFSCDYCGKTIVCYKDCRCKAGILFCAACHKRYECYPEGERDCLKEFLLGNVL